MKILTCEQIRKVDQKTIEGEPVDSIDLMERAAQSCCDWLTERFGDSLNLKIFVGSGNNGGDGLAIARIMTDRDCTVEVFMLSVPEKLSEDAYANYKRLSRHGGVEISQVEENLLSEIYDYDIVIDAIFGSGLSRSVEGLAAKTISHINNSEATVVAIDIPSGLFGESNKFNHSEAIVEADYTLTFQMPKQSFFFAENEKYVGEWFILDIGLLPEAIDEQETKYFLTEYSEIVSKLKPRKKFAHKGNFGHALLVAGSYGKIGAAVLASRACLKSGVGLLTVNLPRVGYSIIQTAVPEAMAICDNDENIITGLPELSNYKAIGIGPGIGTSEKTAEAFFNLLRAISVHLVIDADGLNILSMNQQMLGSLPANCILTPHPGEFDRLVGSSASSMERLEKQVEFSRVNKVVVVLKGANTSVTTSDGNIYFNSTGNPGMATAGSGDVLTGIILSLLAQGYSAPDAARVGVYVHGLAGDLAKDETGEEGLIATDIINNIGRAFKNLKAMM